MCMSCTYICLYIDLYSHIHTYIYVQLHVNIYICMYTYMYVYMCIYICIYTRKCACIYVYRQIKGVCSGMWNCIILCEARRKWAAVLERLAQRIHKYIH